MPLNSLPDDWFPPCQVCGNEADGCKCPLCPVCGSQGDEACVVIHGQVNHGMNQEHIRLWAEAELHRRAARLQDEAYVQWQMEQDAAYEAAHGVKLDGPPYSEHDDSAYQCGKDRDDR